MCESNAKSRQRAQVWLKAPVTARQARRFLTRIAGCCWDDFEALAVAAGEPTEDFLMFLAVRAEMAYWHRGLSEQDAALRESLERLADVVIVRPAMEAGLRERIAFFWETLAEGAPTKPISDREALLLADLQRRLYGTSGRMLAREQLLREFLQQQSSKSADPDIVSVFVRALRTLNGRVEEP